MRDAFNVGINVAARYHLLITVRTTKMVTMSTPTTTTRNRNRMFKF